MAYKKINGQTIGAVGDHNNLNNNELKWQK